MKNNGVQGKIKGFYLLCPNTLNRSWVLRGFTVLDAILTDLDIAAVAALFLDSVPEHNLLHITVSYYPV